MSRQTLNEYFGACPECGKSDGYINIGRGHWFFCKAHKTQWLVGTNLLSSWREQTEEEQRRIYEEGGFGEFEIVSPRSLIRQVSTVGRGPSDVPNEAEHLPF